MNQQYQTNICANFSKAAKSYDHYADIQKSCGEELSQQIPATMTPKNILEIGCGTGNLTNILSQKFPSANIVALDFSIEMLNIAKSKYPDNPNIAWVNDLVEDFLEISIQKFDLIISNATLQWPKPTADIFQNIQQALAPNGLFLATLFGPKSLNDLSLALQACENPKRQVAAHDFPPLELLQELGDKHFKNCLYQEKVYTKTYKTLLHLFQQIKGTGTNGSHQVPIKFTKKLIRDMEEWFSTRKQGIVVQYHVIYLQGQQR